jgi:hypothetical protein
VTLLVKFWIIHLTTIWWRRKKLQVIVFWNQTKFSDTSACNFLRFILTPPPQEKKNYKCSGWKCLREIGSGRKFFGPLITRGRFSARFLRIETGCLEKLSLSISLTFSSHQKRLFRRASKSDDLTLNGRHRPILRNKFTIVNKSSWRCSRN